MNQPTAEVVAPTAPLRVVAITPTGFFSGAERVLLNHALAGIRAGDRWTVLAPEGATTDELARHAVPHRLIPELKLGPGARPIEVAKLAGRIIRSIGVIRRAVNDADVIVANSVLALPPLRLVRPKQPVLWLVHDVITRSDLSRLARGTAGVVTRSVPVSRAAGELSQRLGLPTTVVYNGVDDNGVDDNERPDLTPADPPIVGLNAILTHWKGQHVLLDAIGSLDLPCEVELMGGVLPHDAEYAAEITARAQRPDLSGRVRLLGHCDDPRAVMRRWTVAVSASVEPEAGPLSILEAMSLGVPVVVSNHGAAPEMVDDTGIVVPVGDAAALAASIRTLLDDPDRARSVGQAGRVRMRAMFERSNREREFRSVVHDVAAEARTASSP